MFNIGEKVWIADYQEHKQLWMQCPDCAGNKYHTITLGCGDVYTIDCQNCALGFEPPSGRVSYWSSNASALRGEIVGLEKTGGEYEYKVEARGTVFYCKEVFSEEADAVKYAEEKLAARIQEQKDRIFKKEKDTRSWAWNATYHKKCIKRAEKDLEYHTQKLNAAKAHVKEEKK